MIGFSVILFHTPPYLVSNPLNDDSKTLADLSLAT